MSKRNKAGKTYRDMSEKYRDRFDRESFRTQRSNQHKAAKWLERFDGDIDAARRQVFKKTTNLEDFDMGLTGAGGAFSPTREKDGVTRKGFEIDKQGNPTAFGQGVDRLSKRDAVGLMQFSDNWVDEDEDGNPGSKLAAAYQLRDYMNKVGKREGLNDRDGFIGTGAFSYINKQIAKLEKENNVPSTTVDPVTEAPEPIDTAPGTGPGIDDPTFGNPNPGPGSGGGGNNKASRGGANATGAGSTATGVYQGKVTNDIQFGDNALLNDVVFGNQSIVKNYGSGMSGGGGSGYGSALGNAAAYMDEAEDRFNESSGRDYYLGTSEMGVNRALANEYIDPVELSTGVMNRNMALFGLGTLLENKLYGQYQPPTEFVFDNIDPKDDLGDELEELQDLATA